MRVTLQPSGAVLDTLPGEPILNAAQRLGYECPQSCRNGNCHVCAALLVEGRVQQAGETRDHGEIYTCLAQPQEDCVVLWDGVLALGELPVRSVVCQLTECSEMGGDVWRVRLRAPAGKPPRYYAGQYVMLERESGEKSAFSLASAPHAGRDLELHVLVREDSARRLIEQLQRNAMIRVEMPFGDTHLSQLPDGPLVLIAGHERPARDVVCVRKLRFEGRIGQRPKEFLGLRRDGVQPAGDGLARGGLPVEQLAGTAAVRDQLLVHVLEHPQPLERLAAEQVVLDQPDQHHRVEQPYRRA